ncbi:MAG: ribokinase, partial [Oscillospiraceae bacterium]|nr:ribokinase [Oscillospiraceae bacterium]
MKILNFGSCNIDYVYSLDHIVRVGETETTHKLETFPGGKGLNQSIAVARAGAKIYHAGCVGNDGAMLLDILANSGVDISHIRRLGVKNGHAVIQLSSSGENSIFLYPGSNEMIDKELIDKVLCDFGKGDIILLQNEISNVGYIIEKAYKKGMCIIFNPAPFNDGIRNIDFNMISYIVLNEVEAAEMSGFEEPEKSLEYLGCTYPDLRVVLTLGENGCVYMD